MSKDVRVPGQAFQSTHTSFPPRNDADAVHTHALVSLPWNEPGNEWNPQFRAMITFMRWPYQYKIAGSGSEQPTMHLTLHHAPNTPPRT